ncbi:MAG: KEOPS complex subunit Cgi121 [Halobacteriales archaeon]
MRLIEGTTDVADVTGFVDDLGAIGADHGGALQAFDARYVAGPDHLRIAVERANRAFEREDAIADDRAVEILCYAAARRQINRAMEMGVSEGEGAVVVVVDGGDEAGAAKPVRDLVDPDPVLESASDPELIRDFFDVTDAEMAATDATLEDLVIERVSLLVVEK